MPLPPGLSVADQVSFTGTVVVPSVESVVKLCFGAVAVGAMVSGGVVLFSRTDTLSEFSLATARSTLVSLLNSAPTTEAGLVPAAKFCAVPKVPSPLPRRTETPPGASKPQNPVKKLQLNPLYATARSALESPLKSALLTEKGPSPPPTFGAATKVPSPLPKSTET